MRKLIVIIFIFLTYLNSAEINTAQLEIQAKIYPKLLTFVTNFDKKYPNSIVIAIVYSDEFETEAEEFKSLVYKNFTDGIKNKKVELFLIPENITTQSKINIDAAYILSNSTTIKNTIAQLNKKGIVTMSGTDKALELGALFGIKISERIQLRLNKKTFQNGKYIFDQSLLRTVTIYEEN